MRVLKSTVEVQHENHVAVLTAGMREEEVREIAPWAFKRGILPAGSWQKVKDTPQVQIRGGT
jgi:hypothetical protein